MNLIISGLVMCFVVLVLDALLPYPRDPVLGDNKMLSAFGAGFIAGVIAYLLLER